MILGRYDSGSGYAFKLLFAYMTIKLWNKRLIWFYSPLQRKFYADQLRSKGRQLDIWLLKCRLEKLALISGRLENDLVEKPT